MFYFKSVIMLKCIHLQASLLEQNKYLKETKKVMFTLFLELQ